MAYPFCGLYRRSWDCVHPKDTPPSLLCQSTTFDYIPVYFTRFGYTTPLRTAVIFVSFAILMDFFVVALLVQRSLEMFASPLGTWIPFGLMFASTYLTGLALEKRSRAVAAD
jgi:hypothetical protein